MIPHNFNPLGVKKISVKNPFTLIEFEKTYPWFNYSPNTIQRVNDKLFFNSSSYTPQFEIFNINTKTIEIINKSPFASVNTSLKYNDIIYYPSNSIGLYLFNIQTETIKQKDISKQYRQRNTIQQLDDKIYLPNNNSDILEIYDMFYDTYQYQSAIADVRNFLSYADRWTSQLINRKIYIPICSVGVMEIYDCDEQIFREVTMCNYEENIYPIKYTSQQYNGKIYVFNQYFIEIFDTQTELTRLININMDFDIMLSELYNGKIYFMLFGDESKLFIFDILSESLTSVNIPCSLQQYIWAMYLDNNLLYIPSYGKLLIINLDLI